MAKIQKRKTNKPVDTTLLKATMLRAGFTQEQVSQAIGISASRLNLKINNRADFSHPEIIRVVNVLKLNREETEGIFLPNCF